MFGPLARDPPREEIPVSTNPIGLMDPYIYIFKFKDTSGETECQRGKLPGDGRACAKTLLS